MNRTIVFSLMANAELCEARDWYEARDAGLGDEFMELLDDLVVRIAANPELFPVSHRGLRRAVMRRFPYVLYCKVEPATLTVVSVFHAKRKPRGWMGRG